MRHAAARRRLAALACAAIALGLGACSHAPESEEPRVPPAEATAREAQPPRATAREARPPRATQRPCRPRGAVPEALARCRNWIAYAPPTPFNPEAGAFPSEEELRESLRGLVREGWRGLVTYSLDGSLAAVPRIARQAGFDKVIAGVFWYDDEQLRRERRAALAERRHIDAYVLGHEGLAGNRYTLPRLRDEIDSLRASTGRPVTTAEPLASYRRIAALATEIGDWAFPIVHPWWAQRRRPADAARWVRGEYCALRRATPRRAWVVKEAWWPTSGSDPAASDRNQRRFLAAILRTPLPVVQGEAYDQGWKREPGGVGSAWGWHAGDGRPKGVVEALAGRYAAQRQRADGSRACEAGRSR